jgi:hypothetical protein
MSTFLIALRKYASVTRYRRAFYLCVLCLVALIDYIAAGRTFGTFVFYRVRSGAAFVETRSLPSWASLELRAARYVEEALLGPESVEAGRLFPKGTRLESLLIRDGVAYVDLSASAALPTETEIDARRSIATLASGLERNFGSIKKALVFISGHEPFAMDRAKEDEIPAAPKKTKSVDK